MLVRNANPSLRYDMIGSVTDEIAHEDMYASFMRRLQGQPPS